MDNRAMTCKNISLFQCVALNTEKSPTTLYSEIIDFIYRNNIETVDFHRDSDTMYYFFRIVVQAEPKDTQLK